MQATGGMTCQRRLSKNGLSDLDNLRKKRKLITFPTSSRECGRMGRIENGCFPVNEICRSDKYRQKKRTRLTERSTPFFFRGGESVRIIVERPSRKTFSPSRGYVGYSFSQVSNALALRKNQLVVETTTGPSSSAKYKDLGPKVILSEEPS